MASAGAPYKASFRVGHGCGASPVRQIVVQIPEGVQGAKPMPKAGWTLAIARAPLALAYSDHGRRVTEGVSSITWTASTPGDQLQNDWYDEFVLQARLPERSGPMYWQVSQVCEQGRVDWTDLPKPGQALSELKNPAALLELLPAERGGHSH